MKYDQPKLPAYEQAAKYLSAKMYSVADLSHKLLLKGYDKEEVDEALSQLSNEGFLDDENYAQVYLRNLMEYRTFGYYGMRNKLLQKRLPKDLVDKLLNAKVSEEAELVIAERFADKKKKSTKDSLVRSMQQKGFRTSVILKIINSR